MLVVVGANGRTGVEITREALRRGRTVRAVVRDDRDARNLDDIIDVQHISYADPDHPGSLPAALAGASEVIIAIDPRTGGPGTPIYSDDASSNVVRAAAEAGAAAEEVDAGATGALASPTAKPLSSSGPRDSSAFNGDGGGGSQPPAPRRNSGGSWLTSKGR